MKTMHIILVLFLMVFHISCSHVYNVHYDYDKNADFSTLKTYDWMSVSEKSNIDRLDGERVEDAVNAELQTKGLKMSSENPDFLINAHLGKKDMVNVRNRGPVYSGGFMKETGDTVTQVEVGSLVLDFIYAKSKELIWRGQAKALVDDETPPEKRERLIKEAVQKILKNFPPPS